MRNTITSGNEGVESLFDRPFLVTNTLVAKISLKDVLLFT